VKRKEFFKSQEQEPEKKLLLRRVCRGRSMIKKLPSLKEIFIIKEIINNPYNNSDLN
jgi:hypothetical protein